MEQTREIYLAGGCFWGVEHYIKKIAGVCSTQVGYANSLIATPTYKEVCSGRTEAVETVRVIYDPSKIALSYLLSAFYRIINPTSLNKQGGDVGTQYRTGVYYTDPKDAVIVADSLALLQKKYTKSIVVECMPLKNYFSAEEYHQEYLTANPAGYCHVALENFALAKTFVCPPEQIEKDEKRRNE